MKAAICTKYGSPDVLKIMDVKKPIYNNDEMLIKIHASVVTSSDTFTRNINVLPILFWIPARLALGLARPRKPILGMVLAGEIVSIGKNIKRFKSGDNVFAHSGMQFGSYAEYICLREDGKCGPKETLVSLMPSGLTYEEAAAIPYGGTIALHFLQRIGKLQKGQRLLVYGASGSVGTSAVQLGKYLGAEVTGVCSTINMELVEAIGASKVIDYTKDNSIEKIETYDVIFDAVGKRKTSNFKKECKKALKPGGKFISVDGNAPQLNIDDLIFLKNLCETGQWKPVIDRCFPLEKIVEAHAYVDKGHKKGNVVISIIHSK